MSDLVSTKQVLVAVPPRAAVGYPHMVRGLVNGVVLSLAIWLAAGYLAFILH